MAGKARGGNYDMKIYHVLIFQREEKEGRTLFTAALAENHNVAVHKVVESDVRIEKNKIQFILALDSEQIQNHIEEIQKLVAAGKELAKKHSAMLINDTLKTTN
jgi:hypothetical protein